jgi:hypothetical protein
MVTWPMRIGRIRAWWSALCDLRASSPSDQGTYREPWNSTWSAFAISGESEGEPSNGGRETRLGRSNALHIPDYGAVILERVD